MKARPPTPNRRELLRAAAATPFAHALAGALGAEEEAARTCPNVLLLVSDDQGRELGAYGNQAVTTPALDRLAAEGCRFERAYTPVALCTPSRSALYTGMYPVKNGATGFDPIRAGVRTFGELLGEAGFQAGLIGKLHVKPRDRFPFEFLRTVRIRDAQRNRVGWYVEAFEALLDARDERPFCATVAFHDPHWPLPVDGAPTGWKGAQEEPHDPRTVAVPPLLVDAPMVRAELARFYDAIRRMDVTVGALLEVLERRGLTRDTLVLFTSDNGMPFPFAKATPYEAGVCMPLLARWPGTIDPGSTCDALVSFVDVLPTCLGLIGADVPEQLDGCSLVPLFTGEQEEVHDAVFGAQTEQAEHPAVASRWVRRGDLKYIRNFRTDIRFDARTLLSETWATMKARAADDAELAARLERLEHRPEEELYDLSVDPHELRSLAQDPKRESARNGLRALLAEFMAAQKDPLLAEWER